MNTTVTARPLPHAAIPFAQVRDAAVRDVLMKMNENVKSLKRQLEAVQREINMKAR